MNQTRMTIYADSPAELQALAQAECQRLGGKTVELTADRMVSESVVKRVSNTAFTIGEPVTRERWQGSIIISLKSDSAKPCEWCADS